MTEGAEWQAHKAEGNACFKSKDFLKAAAQYSAAIKAFEGSDPDLAVLHRWGRFAGLDQFSCPGRWLAV
jgi:hypothetical protein